MCCAVFIIIKHWVFKNSVPSERCITLRSLVIQTDSQNSAIHNVGKSEINRENKTLLHVYVHACVHASVCVCVCVRAHVLEKERQRAFKFKIIKNTFWGYTSIKLCKSCRIYTEWTIQILKIYSLAIGLNTFWRKTHFSNTEEGRM